jgi:hypothetical protein
LFATLNRSLPWNEPFLRARRGRKSPTGPDPPCKAIGLSNRLPGSETALNSGIVFLYARMNPSQERERSDESLQDRITDRGPRAQLQEFFEGKASLAPL